MKKQKKTTKEAILAFAFLNPIKFSLKLKSILGHFRLFMRAFPNNKHNVCIFYMVESAFMSTGATIVSACSHSLELTVQCMDALLDA